MTEYMNETLPCGHRVPLFESVTGKMVPIACPSERNKTAFLNIPAVVWCVEIDRPSCGWVSVSDEEFDRITVNGHA